jgi:hypothetical protein
VSPREHWALLWLFGFPLFFISGCLAGCVTVGPTAEQIHAFSESKRSWCFTQSNVYVPFLVTGGTGIEGGKMECNREGMKVDDKTVPYTPLR